jgi:hypothetical protein
VVDLAGQLRRVGRNLAQVLKAIRRGHAVRIEDTEPIGRGLYEAVSAVGGELTEMTVAYGSNCGGMPGARRVFSGWRNVPRRANRLVDGTDRRRSPSSGDAQARRRPELTKGLRIRMTGRVRNAAACRSARSAPKIAWAGPARLKRDGVEKQMISDGPW